MKNLLQRGKPSNKADDAPESEINIKSVKNAVDNKSENGAKDTDEKSAKNTADEKLHKKSRQLIETENLTNKSAEAPDTVR